MTGTMPSRPHLLSLWNAPCRGGVLLPAPRPSVRPSGGSVVCRSQSARKPKDPKAYGSIDELRADLEKGEPGFVTGLITWLSQAATSASDVASGFDLRAAYRALMSRRRGVSTKSWDEELAELDELEAQVGAEAVSRLAIVLLGTRQSTLKIIRRYPAVMTMDTRHLMERLVWLKGQFPGSDISRMVELQPGAFLGGDWGFVRHQVGEAAGLLRGSLAGADLDFMFQEDPAILFEEHDSLRTGLDRLHELWAVDEAALGNSDPLHLTLAVRALGHNGPPKGF